MEQHYDESKYQGEVTIPFHARANEQSSLEIPEALKQAAAFIQVCRALIIFSGCGSK